MMCGKRISRRLRGRTVPGPNTQGPERIAISNGYVKHAKVGTFAGLLPGDKIASIDKYLPRYDFASAIEWAAGKFRFRKLTSLSFATVDFAALDLRDRGLSIAAGNVPNLIESEPNGLRSSNEQSFQISGLPRRCAS